MTEKPISDQGRRRNLAKALGHEVGVLLELPSWGTLLREVKNVVKEAEDLKSMRKILRL